MARGILTNREVKNKVTGVDIYVSDYQEVPHRIKNEYLYHVIVVSNLFYYKTREHRESDVVQFMVSKTFSDFEDLYRRLYKRFPSVSFPPLPKKTLLSANAAGNLECMDKVLKMVASTQKLSSSPMVISFLRGDKCNNVNDDDDDEEQEEIEAPEVNEVHKEDVVDGGQQHEEGEFQDVDLFASKQEEVGEEEIVTENIENVSSGRSIFDEDVVDSTTAGGADNDLFVTDETKTSTYNKEYDINADLDILELSDSDCEVDELMNLSKLSERQSAIKVQKTQPCKQRMNIFTKESGNVFDNKSCGNIFDSKSSGKEDMFNKKSKQTNKKCLWRDHNHHTIEDIFCSKETSLFDTDDGDDLFRTSKKKVEVKVDDMKQEDIMDYINQHNGGESTEYGEEKKHNTIDSSENDTSLSKEHNSLEHNDGVCSTEHVECSAPTNMNEEPTDTSLMVNNVIVEGNSVQIHVEEGDCIKPPPDVDIYDTGEDVASVIHHPPTAKEQNDTVTSEAIETSKDDAVESSNYIADEQKDDVASEVTCEVEEECNIGGTEEVSNDARALADQQDSLIPTEENDDFIIDDGGVEDGINVVTEDYSTSSFAGVEEGINITSGINDTTHVTEEQCHAIATENDSIEDFNS